MDKEKVTADIETLATSHKWMAEENRSVHRDYRYPYYFFDFFGRN